MNRRLSKYNRERRFSGALGVYVSNLRSILQTLP